MTTPNIGLIELGNSAGNYLLANETFAILDALVGKVVKDKDLNAPPGSPQNGDVYIIGPSPTGLWAGHAKKIAFWSSTAGAWVVITPKEGWKYEPVDEDTTYRFDGTNWVIWSAGGGALTQSFVIACSDETTAVSTGTNKVTFRMPYAFTLTAVRASLSTAQASGSILTVDINEGGSSILSTKLTIDNTEKTSTTAATPPVMADTSLADDAEITIDVDQVGDGTAKGLKVVLIGTKT